MTVCPADVGTLEDEAFALVEVSQEQESAANCGFISTQKALGDVLKSMICDNGKMLMSEPITDEKLEVLKNSILQQPIFDGLSLPTISDDMILKITAGGEQCKTAIADLVSGITGTSLTEDFNNLATEPNLIDDFIENIEDEIILDKYFNEEDFEDDNPCLSTLDYYRGLKDGFSGSWTDLWEAIKSLKELETYKNLYEGVKVLTCPPPCPDAEIAIKQAKMIEKLIEWLNSNAPTPDCYEDGRRTGKIFTDLLAGEGIAAASKRGLKLLAKAAEKAKVKTPIELSTVLDDVIKVVEEDGYAVIKGKNNEFVGRGWLGTDGELNLVIITKGTSLEGQGRQVFKELFKFINEEFDEVKKIRGTWRSSDKVADNLNTFNNFIKQNYSPNEAAMNTFTGKIAKEVGFSKSNVLPTSIKNVDGTYKAVDVIFIK
ncbi:MAG: hypothetical protein CFE21_22575 [Bacteroidetes bacterium B1(2017)]|nr:MAG: hypothetical protein CFE21_22575 [Bacteroidetes bacterium B1(2017)]